MKTHPRSKGLNIRASLEREGRDRIIGVSHLKVEQFFLIYELNQLVKKFKKSAIHCQHYLVISNRGDQKDSESARTGIVYQLKMPKTD